MSGMPAETDKWIKNLILVDKDKAEQSETYWFVCLVDIMEHKIGE